MDAAHPPPNRITVDMNLIFRVECKVHFEVRFQVEDTAWIIFGIAWNGDLCIGDSGGNNVEGRSEEWKSLE